MSETSSGEKTEKPSAQRLKDARKRGDVARSRDLAMAIALLAVVFVLAKTGPSMRTVGATPPPWHLLHTGPRCPDQPVMPAG